MCAKAKGLDSRSQGVPGRLGYWGQHSGALSVVGALSFGAFLHYIAPSPPTLPVTASCWSRKGTDCHIATTHRNSE